LIRPLTILSQYKKAAHQERFGFWRYDRLSRCEWLERYIGARSLQGSLAMRLRLSAAATSAVLAEHYRKQAEMCHQLARMTVSPFKEGWLEFAAEWTKLAKETEGKSCLEREE
jgi:hypothetical protein